MNHHERWILEAACTLRYPIRALTGEGVQERFNRRHHGLDPTGVASVLRKLLRENLIVLSRGHGEAPLFDDDEELRRLVEVEYRGPLFKTTYYGLTADGGAVWESVACPDWDRYLDVSFGTDPNDGEVISVDSARADGYVFSPYQEHPPLAGSVRRDRVESWPATYWKTLPLGHRIRFLYDPNNSIEPEYGSDARGKMLAWLDDANRWFMRDGS